MLEAYSYVAMLHCRNAELEALSHLDNAISPKLLPILSLGPGQFNDFADSLEKYKACSQNLRVCLTLDDYKLGKSKRSPAKEQFDALFDPTEGFKNFFEIVANWQASIPVLCSLSGVYENAPSQVKRVRDLDRGLLVRIRRHEYAHFLEIMEQNVFNEIDCAFAIDAEWSRDILQSENWMSRAIMQIISARPDAEIVCLSSSFPKDFKHVKGRGVFSNDDRDLFDRLKRRHNEARLIYGDWGSTRPSEETIANKPRPRIDIPTERDWICFRQDSKEGEGYAGQARKAESDRIWTAVPDCWGKRLIELTALERPAQIRGSHRANSARINLHLTTQAMVGTMDAIPEEPFKDRF